jgi:excisionase family DNA binding protein
MNRTAYRISDLPIGKTKAYEEIRDGRLRAVKCGKLTLILPDDLDRWLKSLSPVASKSSEQRRPAMSDQIFAIAQKRGSMPR